MATTTTVTSSTQNNTSTYGQAVTFNSTVVTNPVGFGTPTGSVDFVDATTGQDLGTFTLQNGNASVVVSSLAAENHSIQAHYIANSGFDLTSSGTLTQTVNPATLIVTANSVTRVFGQANPVLAATITGFVNNDPSTAVSGAASLMTSATSASPVGVYPIVVTQGTLNAANYSFTFVNGTLTVGKAGSSTAASASLSTPSFGQAEKFTAVITAVAPGTGTPTGSVDFTDTTTGVDLGSVSLVTGTASLNTSSLPVGSNTITETYLGDGNFTSSSTTITITIKQSVIVLDPSASGALNLSGNAHVTFGGNVTIDSSSPTALTTSGNAIVSAAGIQIVGGFVKGANDQFTPMPTTGATALANPVSTFTLPSLTGLTSFGAVNVANPTTLNPGSYTSISISSSGTVALNPGTYLILGGGFTESGNANVTASGVTFVIDGGGFNMSGNAILTGSGDSIFNTTTTNTSNGTAGALNVSGNSYLNITGPATGPNAGVVIYQPSFNTQVLTFSGNAIAGLTEAIIAPGAQLALTGNANVNAAIVVKQLAMSGNAIAQVHANTLLAVGLTPVAVRSAYGFNQIALGSFGQPSAGDGSGQTIAIVDAYDDPTIASDLHQFNKTFDLADASFTKVMPEGTPAVNAGWSEEIALDVEWAHAIAPGAKILLVEAATASVQDLLQAVDYARQQPGVVAVSMSWATNEFAGETALDNYFTTPTNHAGVTFVAAAGDTNAVSWPAVSPNVLSVGGTSLSVTSNGVYLGESASNDGSGLSQFENEPSYQQLVQTSGRRSTPDVAYNADPNQGFAVYDSAGGGGWLSIGGTSAGAPQWAGLVAIADQGRALQGQSSLDGPAQTLVNLYQMAHVSSATYFNQVGGSSFNLTTGLGSPHAGQVVQALVSGSTAVVTNKSFFAAHSQTNSTLGTQTPGYAVQAAAIAERVVLADAVLAGRSLSVVADSGSTLASSPRPSIIPAQLHWSADALGMTVHAGETTTGMAMMGELAMQGPLDGRGNAEGVITLGLNFRDETQNQALADSTFSLPAEESLDLAECLLNEESITSLIQDIGHDGDARGSLESGETSEGAAARVVAGAADGLFAACFAAGALLLGNQRFGWNDNACETIPARRLPTRLLKGK